jgi:hypothetical protein
MEVIYEALCRLRDFLGFLWIITFFWLLLSKKKIHCRMNNIPFIIHVDWSVKLLRRVLLIQALLPPYTPINFVLLFFWYVAFNDVKRHKWELTFQRIYLRSIEREILKEKGVAGLIELFERVVPSVSQYLSSLEPGSTRYNLTVNLYIKCQRRLEKMRRGENFGHFPIPK